MILLRQRLCAVLLIGLAGGALAFTSRRWEFVAAVTAAGLLGLPGRVQLRLTQAKRNIVLLLLAAVFAVQWNIAPFQDAGINGFLFFPLTYAAAQYLLASMAARMFFHYEQGLPPVVPLVGVVALVCGGNILTIDLNENRGFQLLVLGYMAATALYYCVSTPHLKPAGPHGGRRAMIGVLLVIGLVMAWAAGEYVRRNSDFLRRLLMVRRRRQADTQLPGFGDPGKLTSVNLMRSGQDQTVLWAQWPAAPGYLRGAAFEIFSESTWSSGRAASRLAAAGQPPPPLAPPGPAEQLYVLAPVRPEGGLMAVHPTPELPMRVFAPLETQAFYAPAANVTVTDHRNARSGDLAGGLGYRLWVGQAPVSEADQTLLQRCLEVPLPLASELREMADRLFAGRRTTAQKVQAVTAWLTRDFRYSLSIDIPRQADPLVHFLTEARAAHCEYFASAATVLLRLGGVPARYVTGFVTQRYNRMGDYWYARNRDAHAWCEAYDESARAWVTVEATPAAGVPAGEQEASWWGRLWDYLDFRIQELREAVGMHGWKGLGLWLLGAIAEMFGLLIFTWPGRVLLAVLVFRRVRRWWKRQAARQGPRPVGPQVVRWRRMLARMDRRLARRGLIREPAETLHQFAARVACDQALAAVAAWYVRAACARFACRLDEQEMAVLESEGTQLQPAGGTR